MNVGDYVRTDTGQIGKITLFEGDLIRVDADRFITYKSKHNEIIKSSPRIINLVEVGDYVNGVEVENIDDEWITMSDNKIPILKSIANGYIESIVTKEQFETMQYRVEE